MTNRQLSIIAEQMQANQRMVRLNAERGIGLAHGQAPVNERVQKVRSTMEADSSRRKSKQTGSESDE
jgi:hypothetical protein